MKKTIPQCVFTLDQVTDHLAADRTILANERTVLSYLRFAFALFVAGVSAHKIFETLLPRIIGIVLIPLALLVAVTGILRYRRCKLFLLTLKENKNETVPAPPRGTSAEG